MNVAEECEECEGEKENAEETEERAAVEMESHPMALLRFILMQVEVEMRRGPMNESYSDL